MKNRYKKGEIVIVNGIGKNSGKEYKNVIGVIEDKDYYFVQYKVNIMFDDSDWFHERDITRVFEKENKKMFKYKICFATSKAGLDFVLDKIDKNDNKTNNLFKQSDVFQSYYADNKEYIFIIWSKTYWAENNTTVKTINKCLPMLRANNIPYQFISVGINNKEDIIINEFIKNDKNVDVFEVSTNIKIKKFGGII